MKITQEQLNILCQIVKDAGAEVMAVYNQPVDVQVKDDMSPLTEADLRADRVIRQGLEKNFPNFFILSEESSSESSEQKGNDSEEAFFLVDPLDGTKEFLKRNGEFTVNIALIHKGKAIAGAVFAPALDELFFAAADLGVWKTHMGNTQLIQTASLSQDKLRVVGSRSHGSEQADVWLSNLNREFELMPAGSSLKFCKLAEGKADIYPRFGPTSQWDTAAAQCVLEIAGGAVVDVHGHSLVYGLDLPILNKEFIALGTTPQEFQKVFPQAFYE